MNNSELPPDDRSDHLSQTPREALRQYVRELAIFTTNADIDVTQWGIHDLSDEKTLIARVVDFTRALDPETRQLFPEHILELSVWDDTVDGIETLVISDGDDELVTAYISDMQYDLEDPDQADVYIQAFALRHNIPNLITV